jgi:DNA-binding SARP family transcriptional activator
MTSTDEDGLGNDALAWRTGSWAPSARQARAGAPGGSPTESRAESLAGSLATGAAEVMHAVQDCVEEIRFHQGALVRAARRHASLTRCLNELIHTVHHRTQVRRAGAASQGADADTMPRSGTAAPGSPLQTSSERAGGAPAQARQAGPRPSLSVFCLGPTRILQDGQPIEDWPNGKGKSVFKYLLLHHRQPVAKERLMQLFWPDADPEAARNNLNVTIYGLRRVLGRAQPDVSHVVLEDGCYRLSTVLDLWLDAEVFEERARVGREHQAAGRTEEAVAAYREAEQLYHGELFADERPEDWHLPDRQRVRECALDLLRRLSRLSIARQDPNAAVSAHRRVLQIDPCDEESHRELMRLYAQQDQPQLAVRQFRACAEALASELHMIPSPETTALYRRIQQREVPVSAARKIDP